MPKKLMRGSAVGAAAFAAALVLFFSNALGPLEWKSWDLRLRLFSDPGRANPDIVLLFIDQYSLDLYEKEQNLPWPWPREIYSAVIRYLEKGGAKAVFFDLILSESSRSGVEDDAGFAREVATSGKVFIPFFLSEEEKESDPGARRLLERFALKGEAVSGGGERRYRSVTLPLAGILESARGSGNVRYAPDGDAIYRRIPLVFPYEGLLLPSLPLALADFIEGGVSPGDIPVDGSGQMIIRYRGPEGTYESFNIASIINSWAQLESGRDPQIAPCRFKDKIVFIGANAPGLLDLRPTPFSAVCPGVEIHAAALDNLLRKDFVRMPPFAASAALLLFFALLASVGTTFIRKIWLAALFFFFCLSLPAAAAAAGFFSNFWLEFAVPEAAVLLGFMGAALLNYGIEGRERRFIKSVFRHYLSADVIERILRDPSLLRLGGARRDITAFFSDVAGFTSVSENLSPEDLVALLNEYLSEMTDIILETGGTLDKYEGDAIIAFWNAPLDQPDHALRACRAALRCRRKLEEMAPAFRSRYGHEIRMRIGLNSGPAVVGNMGSQKRFDYTAMGDTMNLASRLEGACKLYKVPILVGEDTYARCGGGIVAREVDVLRVVGKKTPVRVYEIVGERGNVPEAELRRISDFHSALEAYRSRNWPAALSLFRGMENDNLAAMYIERCRSFEKAPPPGDWDGVFDLKEK